MDEAKRWRDRVAAETDKVFRGHSRSVDWILTALLAGGHVLLEDVPGVGKTLLAKALAQALGGDFSRVQGTPDLLPSDLLGFSVYRPQDGSFEFRTGPVETFLLLFDEINRASPRTQSALLQAMAEGEVSRDGRVVALPDPFLVLATENPVEFEGTFPLPEAQKDRFLLTFALGYPTREQEASILDQLPFARRGLGEVTAVSSPEEVRGLKARVAGVHADPKVRDYVLDLAAATRVEPAFRLGLSPRGSQALFTAAKALALVRGRSWVLPDDVKELFLPTTRGRVALTPSAAARGLEVPRLLEDLLERLPTPALARP
jgi:MoxR-like ATPase